MTFVSGVSGNPAGKRKGSKHKICFEVARILSELKYVDKDGKLQVGFNPFEKLALLAVNARSEKVQCDALLGLTSYVAPKLKHIEHSADSESPFTIILNMGAKKE